MKICIWSYVHDNPKEILGYGRVEHECLDARQGFKVVN